MGDDGQIAEHLLSQRTYADIKDQVEGMLGTGPETVVFLDDLRLRLSTLENPPAGTLVASAAAKAAAPKANATSQKVSFLLLRSFLSLQVTNDWWCRW